ncbi:YbeF family protein [Bacillus sp. NPDC057893]|uniref:YbeF family protein n=1 Tax=Bacillus sp. NPDC057893 TaxID=3346273 RepID=UPI00366B2A5B
MNELIFVLLICPLLIFIASVIGTRRTRTYYVMPFVTFASFLIVGAIAFPPKFFFWVGMYSIFSFIISYMTLLFVRGYEVAESNK